MSFLYGWVSEALGGLGLGSNKRPREPDTDTGAASSQPSSPLGSPGRHRLFSSSDDVEEGSTTTGGESSLAEEEPEDRGALAAALERIRHLEKENGLLKRSIIAKDEALQKTQQLDMGMIGSAINKSSRHLFKEIKRDSYHEVLPDLKRVSEYSHSSFVAERPGILTDLLRVIIAEVQASAAALRNCKVVETDREDEINRVLAFILAHLTSLADTRFRWDYALGLQLEMRSLVNSQSLMNMVSHAVPGGAPYNHFEAMLRRLSEAVRAQEPNIDPRYDILESRSA